MPVFTLIPPLRSQSLKYLARVLSRLMSMSLFLKSSSFIHSGMAGRGPFWAIMCLNNESFGTSGYTLARESLIALIFFLRSMVFIAALAVMSASVMRALLTPDLIDILLLRLLKVRSGTCGCPFFGSTWKPFLVFSTLMEVPSESLNESLPALTLPPKGYMRLVVSSDAVSSTMFFAATLKSLIFSFMASLYDRSALAISPVMPISLNDLVVSLLETLSSGPRTMRSPSISALMLSEGMFTVMLSARTSPISDEREKL